VALADFAGAGFVEALFDDVGELVGLHTLGLDVEVGVEVGAERLDEVDLGLEGDAALLLEVADHLDVLEVLGTQAGDHLSLAALDAEVADIDLADQPSRTPFPRGALMKLPARLTV
jgi:hypothetical protein